MRKLGFIVLISIISLLFAIACQSPAQPATFTDDAGRSVTINKIPQRLVSHVPSITETLFALGLGDRVVGVSDWDEYPPEAKQKPSVGDYFNPSIELIIAQDPDIVLTDGHSETIKQLDNLGKTYAVINPKDMDGIFKDLELLGKITGSDAKAKELTTDMQKRINEVASVLQGAPRVKVFYIIDAVTDPNNPWTAGQGSFIDSLITMAGGENVAGNSQGSYVQYSIEQVVNAEPEMIVINESMGTLVVALETLKRHPVWGKLEAVKNEKVFFMNPDLMNPVPRIVEGLEKMAKLIHPERFK